MTAQILECVPNGSFFPMGWWSREEVPGQAVSGILRDVMEEG